MDNEEIRELLKELKESSDESSAVRSRVVKIHFDTPQEAERRERARRKAAEAARQKALEEEEERRAEEEARREAAEKEAEAVVAEAKAEAAAEFSADLGKDLLSQETGEDHFYWEYKYRHLSEESPAPAGGEVLSGTDEKERPSGKGKSTSGEADEEEPDDQEDWKRRMEESPDGSRKKASFKGLSGRLPGLKSIKGRSQSWRAKDAEEEEEPEAEADRPEEISEDFETDPVSSGKRRGRKAAEFKTPESKTQESRLSESRASESKTSEARKKRIAAPDQDDFESDADYFRDDEPEEKREKKASAGRASALFAGAAGVLASLKGAVSGKGSGDRKRGKKTEEDDFPDELPVEGEEKGRAYDGNPVTDDYDIDPELAYLFEDEEDEPFGTEDADFGPAEQEVLPEESDLQEEGPDSEAVSLESADFSAKAETAPAGSGTEAFPEAEADRESPDPDQAGGDTGLKAGEQPGQDARK